MRVLLDTHVLLWLLYKPERLSAVARNTLEDPGNELLFSAASVWEIAIKAQLRRADFNADPAEVAADASEYGVHELPVRSSVAAAVTTLPMHHRDPFDRLLIAQAIAEPARLLTADAHLIPYSELVTLV